MRRSRPGLNFFLLADGMKIYAAEAASAAASKTMSHIWMTNDQAEATAEAGLFLAAINLL